MLAKDFKIAVIGGGISGLASALTLRRKGFAVDVYEQQEWVGGKLNEINDMGFRFDTGPSLFTLPQLFKSLFIETELNEMKFEAIRLENVCRYFWPNGKILDALANIQNFALLAEQQLDEPVSNTLDYLNKAERLYNNISDLFIFNSLHDLKTYKNYGAKGLKALAHLDAFKSLHRLNHKSFKTKEMVQLFDRYATYNGSNPYMAPATLKVISHLEHNTGAYFPNKGMYGIIEMLYNSCLKLGVRFFLSNKVEQVTIDSDQKIFIKSFQGKMKYNSAICAVDVQYFYKNLFKQVPLPKRIEKAGFSSSAVIFYWGVNKVFPELDVHNILFSENYKSEFDEIFIANKVPADPTVYIFISSKIVPSDAPLGQENWFVMVNVPADEDKDWDREYYLKLKTIVVAKIKKILGIDIENHIVYESYGNPATIYNSTSSTHGAIYGNHSNNMFSAFNRHPNYSKKLPNLYFTGGSVHPGGGIPLCIASAKIVSEQLIKKYLKYGSQT